VFGSIILAGVLLKTGGYGGFLLLSMFGGVGGLRLILIGCFFSIFITLGQRDLKRIVAYTSVFHIRLVFLLFCFNYFFVGAVSFYIFLVHRLTSSLFFLFVSDIFYIRGSRNLLLNFGAMVYFGDKMLVLLSLIFLVNLGVPPTLGFIFEVGVCYFLVL